jgi:hypothetical protein
MTLFRETSSNRNFRKGKFAFFQQFLRFNNPRPDLPLMRRNAHRQFETRGRIAILTILLASQFLSYAPDVQGVQKYIL